MSHDRADQAHQSGLLAQMRVSGGGVVFASFTWLIFGAGFVLCTWVGVVPLELADALQGFVIVAAIGWLIAGAILMGQIVKLLPKRAISVYEGVLRDGDTTVDLRHPFEAWVLSVEVTHVLAITVVQEGRRVVLRILGVKWSAACEHYPKLGTQTPANDSGAIGISARDTAANPAFVPALLAQLHRYGANNRATTPTESQGAQPPLPFFGPLLCGWFAINTSAIAVTLLACFSWMPRAASLCFGVTLLGAVFSLVWTALGRTRMTAVTLACLLATVGVYYTSDAIVWRYGDSVTLDELARGGAYRVERPYRLAEGSPRPDWGLASQKERDLPRVWWLAAAPIAADDADKTDPIVLWAMCEKQTSVTYTAQEWSKELTQNCGGQWKGRIMLPAPWFHRDGYLRAVKGTELSFKLKATSNVQMVFSMSDAKGIHQRDLMYSILGLMGANGLWLAFFMALWAAYRLDAQRAQSPA